MAKSKSVSKTYTEAEIAAIVAAARQQGVAEGADKARREKSAARAERNAASGKAGLTMLTVTDERRASNILAEGVFVVPGVCVIEATAVMTKRDGSMVPRFRLAANPIFGVNGDTDTDPERLIKATAAKAQHAPVILAALVKDYGKNAPGHVWRDKAAERKAAKACG